MTIHLSSQLAQRVEGFAQHAGEPFDVVLERLVSEGLEYELWLREQIEEGEQSLLTSPSISLQQLEDRLQAIVTGSQPNAA
ncbi:hypothetical protein [Andreprevotia chitinilytica]|uniref:hypothetical protein n=1 Tax=Andreprevotia chitinilytica TaxID=396808 RepID=UPI000556B5DF|nr:hypothetical protein [Andreprevotia chitinilytica]